MKVVLVVAAAVLVELAAVVVQAAQAVVVQVVVANSATVEAPGKEQPDGELAAPGE